MRVVEIRRYAGKRFSGPLFQGQHGSLGNYFVDIYADGGPEKIRGEKEETVGPYTYAAALSVARRLITIERARDKAHTPGPAAPGLLEAAKTVLASLEWEEGRSGTTYAGYDTLRAAIAKAEGRE